MGEISFRGDDDIIQDFFDNSSDPRPECLFLDCHKRQAKHSSKWCPGHAFEMKVRQERTKQCEEFDLQIEREHQVERDRVSRLKHETEKPVTIGNKQKNSIGGSISKPKDPKAWTASEIVSVFIFSPLGILILWIVCVGFLIHDAKNNPKPASNTIPVTAPAPGQAGTIDIGEMDLDDYYRYR